MEWDDKKTVAEKFAGYFQKPYDGSQEDEIARADFVRLTYYRIMWTQVHGDFKDVAKRATFQPYPHWRELHECCGLAVRETIANDKTCLYNDVRCARMMGAAMKILNDKYGFKAPKWWYPVMLELRGVKDMKPAKKWSPHI